MTDGQALEGTLERNRDRDAHLVRRKIAGAGDHVDPRERHGRKDACGNSQVRVDAEHGQYGNDEHHEALVPQPELGEVHAADATGAA